MVKMGDCSPAEFMNRISYNRKRFSKSEGTFSEHSDYYKKKLWEATNKGYYMSGDKKQKQIRASAGSESLTRWLK